MFERYTLAYVFLCFVIGVACLGLVLNLARQRDAVLARVFLGFYVALSVLVASTLLLNLADAFPTALSPSARPALEYVQSIIGFYGFMVMLPFFFHRVFGVASRRRERLLLVFLGLAIALQHVTEYALDEVWDHRGDMVENALFILVVAYVFWVGFSRRKTVGAAQPLGGRLLTLMLIGLPMIVHDLFFAESTRLAFFPVGFCVFSIVVTWTLSQDVSSTAPFAVDPDWNLSGREKEVLELVQRGLSNKDIGSQLHISPNTVKTHLRSIFEKTGAQSRFELIALAQAGQLHIDRVDQASPH